MPPETLKLLWDIRRAAENVQQFCIGRSRADFESDLLFRSGVERQFEIIGEAMTRLRRVDENVLHKIQDYRQIIRFRNVLVHGYDVVRKETGWEIVNTSLPVLLKDVDQLLPPDPPLDSSPSTRPRP